MPFSTYLELKTEITDWMARNDVSGKAVDCITLAEAQLNRKLEVVEADATLTGTVGSRSIDVSAYRIIEPIALYMVEDTGDEVRVFLQSDGAFAYLDEQGRPGNAALDGDNLDFDRKLDRAYSFRLRYRGRFALSDAAPTNDLLTNHPDVYLAACLVWSGLYIRDPNVVQGFKALLNEFIAQTKNHLAQKKRAEIAPTPDLVGMLGGRSYSSTIS